MTRRCCSLILIVLLSLSSHVWAGWIEDCPDGSTMIHLKVYSLPDPANPDASERANVAVVKQFRARFSEIFAERWSEKAKANPDLYGRHNWDRVSIKFTKATGIYIPGVEGDLLQIAGGIAPDVMYINFRKSDTYIRNHFVYPLDEYVAQLPAEEMEQRVHPKIVPVIHRRGPDGEKHYWAFPFGGMLGKVLLYRKDLFDRHNSHTRTSTGPGRISTRRPARSPIRRAAPWAAPGAGRVVLADVALVGGWRRHGTRRKHWRVALHIRLPCGSPGTGLQREPGVGEMDRR